MEAEKEKGQMRDEMIKELRSDKLQLQQQVANLDELLKVLAGKEEKNHHQVKSGKSTLDQIKCRILTVFPKCLV